jgi:uncharacterized protein (DUF779 family)
MELIKRVLVIDEARQLIERLRTEHGVRMFHQSRNVVMFFPPCATGWGSFGVGNSGIQLGEIAVVLFILSAPI